MGRRGSKDPSTLSGFKGLKSLSVLDIDNLDIIAELQTCTRNSYSSLKELHLSLSDSLAQQARRPPADSDAEDSDADDEFQLVPTTENEPNYDATGPAKVFRAQEEKKLQELILNKIFAIEEPHLVKKSPMHLNGQISSSSSAQKPAIKQDGDGDDGSDSRNDFIASIKTASAKLMATLNGSRDFSISQQDILDIIEKAARKYVDSGEASTQAKPTADANAKPDASASDTNNECSAAMPVEVSKAKDGETTESPKDSESCHKDDTVAVRTGRDSARVKHGELSPDDIDIEHLETIEEHLDQFDEQQQAAACATGKKTRVDKTDTIVPVLSCNNSGANVENAPDQGLKLSLASQEKSFDGNDGDVAAFRKKDYEAVVEKLLQLHRLVHTVGQRVLDLRNQRINAGSSMIAHSLDNELAVLNRSAIEVSNEIRILEAEVESMARMAPFQEEAQELKEHMETYARTTRGLSIESLKICLIPVKASVLSQAIDLACIKELTLINVGNQAPIWSMLSKEQKIRPLALRSVFTDHVSASFLTCMAQLPRLDDLFMLERSMKHRPESFAPRTATSIDQIRRLVLKKHMPTLKRLMIKDDSNGPNWDANEKTMILICTKGVQLEELALSMNIHAVVSFVSLPQNLTNVEPN